MHSFAFTLSDISYLVWVMVPNQEYSIAIMIVINIVIAIVAKLISYLERAINDFFAANDRFIQNLLLSFG